MIQFDKIVDELNDALNNLEVETSDIFLKSEKAIQLLIKSSVEALRGLVIKYDFENDEEEIYFFKNTKPLFVFLK